LEVFFVALSRPSRTSFFGDLLDLLTLRKGIGIKLLSIETLKPFVVGKEPSLHQLDHEMIVSLVIQRSFRRDMKMFYWRVFWTYRRL